MDINPLLEQRKISNFAPLCYTNPRGHTVNSDSNTEPRALDSYNVCEHRDSVVDVQPSDMYVNCTGIKVLQANE